jgi:hypothetical protein
MLTSPEAGADGANGADEVCDTWSDGNAAGSRENAGAMGDGSNGERNRDDEMEGHLDEESHGENVEAQHTDGHLDDGNGADDADREDCGNKE